MHLSLHQLIISDYGITGVNISLASPNMNAFVERLNGTIRREALDHFLLFSAETGSKNHLGIHNAYYNNQRMHQGINKIPDALKIKRHSGVIKKMKILSGLTPSLLPFKCLRM